MTVWQLIEHLKEYPIHFDVYVRSREITTKGIDGKKIKPFSDWVEPSSIESLFECVEIQ